MRALLANYDKITGEWKNHQWSKKPDSYFNFENVSEYNYPACTYLNNGDNGYDDLHAKIKEHYKSPNFYSTLTPGIKKTYLPDGSLLHAEVTHINKAIHDEEHGTLDPFTNSMFYIHGYAKDENEALAKTKKYMQAYHYNNGDLLTEDGYGTIDPSNIKIEGDHEPHQYDPNSKDKFKLSKFLFKSNVPGKKGTTTLFVNHLNENDPEQGVSWCLNGSFNTRKPFLGLDHDRTRLMDAMDDIHYFHKDAYNAADKEQRKSHKDAFNFDASKKIAKVYTTERNDQGKAFTKVAEIEQFAPTEVGSGFTGMDPAEQNVGADDSNLSGVDTSNQPEGVSIGIPNKSFLNHDTLASRLFLAEIEDTNYEGVGSVFGEGMGPQELSNNVVDVEEGPNGPKSTEKSTTQLPLGMQGQEILPDLSSWYTASSYFNDDDYKYKNINDSRMFEKEEANDDSDSDDEDDYDGDNNTW
jgi:hypothetical protein